MTAQEDVHLVIKLAGFALAHAAWSVCEGETLCTLAVVENDNERQLFRFEGTISDSLDKAREGLAQLELDGAYWALVFDGYLTPTQGKRQDALVIQIGGKSPLPSRVVQQYQKKSFLRKFKIIGKPLFVEDSHQTGKADLYEQWLQEGIKEHPKVCELWDIWNS